MTDITRMPDGNGAVRRRLDVMIALLLDLGPDPAKSVSQKIARLTDLGLTDAEIAGVIGRKPNYVSAVRSQHRKKGRVSRGDA